MAVASFLLARAPRALKGAGRSGPFVNSTPWYLDRPGLGACGGRRRPMFFSLPSCKKARLGYWRLGLFWGLPASGQSQATVENN